MVYTLIQITREGEVISSLHCVALLDSSESLLGHDVEKVVESDGAISVGVCAIYHLLELLVGHGLTELSGNATEVSQGDGTGVVVIEEAEDLGNVLSGVLVAHAGGHHVEKLLEVDGPALVLI